MINYALTDIIDLETLQQLQDALEEYSSIKALVTDASAKAVTRGHDFSAFFKEILSASAKSSDGNAAAIKEKYLRAFRAGKTLSIKEADATASPIMIEGEFVGLFVCEGSDGKKNTADFFTKIAGALSQVAYKNYLSLNNAHVIEQTAQNQISTISATALLFKQSVQALTGVISEAIESQDIQEMRGRLEQILHKGAEVSAGINDSVQTIEDQNGTTQLVEAEYNLRHIIPPIISHVQKAAAGTPLVFSYNIDGSVPLYLFGDSDRMSQIIYRLLRGSTKHIRDGGRVCLELSCEQKSYAKNLVIKYTNLTKGFSESDLDALQMFIETSDESYLENTKVIGIGYRTVNRLVRQMFGQINFEILSDEQMEFLIKIPQLEVEVPEFDE